MIEVNRQNGLATLRMDYGKVNAMDFEFCQTLIDRLEELQNDDSCHAVVITGKENIFSAGINLKHWLSESVDYVVPFIDKLEQLFQVVFYFRKPCIAAINGHAIAGGCMLAGACDYRIIAGESKIGIPEMRVGVPLPITAIEILRFKADAKAFESVVTGGATFVGKEAVEAGLADQWCDDYQMEGAVSAAAERLCSIPPVTFWFTKRQVRNLVLHNIKTSTEQLRDDFTEIWCSDETRAAVQSYVDERLS